MRKLGVLVVLVLVLGALTGLAYAKERILSPQITANAVSPNQVDLSWEPALGETVGYEVTRSTLSYPNMFHVVGSVAAHVYSFSDTTAEPDMSYYYAVWPIGLQESYIIEPQKTLVTTPPESSPSSLEITPMTTPQSQPTEKAQEPLTNTTKTSVLKIGKKEMSVNGKIVSLDIAPKIENSRTLVPLRAISEALGAEVTWDETTQTITVIQKQGY